MMAMIKSQANMIVKTKGSRALPTRLRPNRFRLPGLADSAIRVLPGGSSAGRCDIDRLPMTGGSFLDEVESYKGAVPTVGRSGSDAEVAVSVPTSGIPERAGWGIIAERSLAPGVREHMDGGPTLLVRVPTAAELDHGYDPSSVVLVSPTAQVSPIPSHSPETRSAFGGYQRDLEVSLATKGSMREASNPLYGDWSVEGILNRLVSGGGKVAEAVKNNFDWSKLTPEAKAALAMLGTAGVAYGTSKLMGPAGYMRLGANLARDDASEGSASGASPESPDVTSVEGSLAGGQAYVVPEAEWNALDKPVYTVANSFFKYAYNLGNTLEHRYAEPNFSILSGDAGVVSTALRGLRCPRVFITPKGELVRSSTPYLAALPLKQMATAARVLPGATPMAGYALLATLGASLASKVLPKVKELLGAGLSKLKDLGLKLLEKVKMAWKKWTAPHTIWRVNELGSWGYPILMTVKALSDVGAMEPADYESLRKEYESIASGMPGYNRNDKWNSSDSVMLGALERFFNFAERLRTSRGVPSERPWNVYPDGQIIGSPGRAFSQRTECPFYQYAKELLPRTVAHMESNFQNAAANSNWTVEHFGTRSPLDWVADANVYTNDLTDLANKIQRSSDGTVAISSSAASAGANGNAASSTGHQPSSAASAPVDPEALLNAAGKGSDTILISDLPAAWRSELPVEVGQTAASRIAEASEVPTKGSPLQGNAWAKVGQFASKWIIPKVSKLIGSGSIKAWGTKTGSKAAAMLQGVSARAAAAAASKSKGAFKAVSAAARWITTKGLKGLASFALNHPKIASIAAFMGVCLAAGGANGRDPEGWSDLLSAIENALARLKHDGVLTSEAADPLIDTLKSIETVAPANLSDAQVESVEMALAVAVMGVEALAQQNPQARGADEYKVLDDLIDAVSRDVDMTDEDLASSYSLVRAVLLTELGGDPDATPADDEESSATDSAESSNGGSWWSRAWSWAKSAAKGLALSNPYVLGVVASASPDVASDALTANGLGFLNKPVSWIRQYQDWLGQGRDWLVSKVFGSGSDGSQPTGSVADPELQEAVASEGGAVVRSASPDAGSTPTDDPGVGEAVATVDSLSSNQIAELQDEATAIAMSLADGTMTDDQADSEITQRVSRFISKYALPASAAAVLCLALGQLARAIRSRFSAPKEHDDSDRGMPAASKAAEWWSNISKTTVGGNRSTTVAL